jgi:hypothetical protein
LKKKSARSLAAVAAAALVTGTSFGGSATAAPATGGDPQILANGLAGPLTTAVAADGSTYVTGNFSGTLLKVPAGGGEPEVVFQSKVEGAEVGGVSVQGGSVVFTHSAKTQKLYRIVGKSAPEPFANLGRYERQNNPDAKRTYGFLGLSNACKAKLPEQVPSAYPGIVDSHPYATEQVGNTVYVADAGGNDILAVSKSGVVKTVAVLKPTKVRATKARVKALGLPTCVTGHKFALEPVPTDVEMGPDGWLYVSSLPGGPEDGSLGALGRVYKVNPDNGNVVLVTKRLVSAVNVAVAPDGDVYVSQLFAGSIVRIPAGTSKKLPFRQVNMPAGLEYTEDGLVATIDALKGTKTPRGKLALIPFVSTP